MTKEKPETIRVAVQSVPDPINMPQFEAKKPQYDWGMLICNPKFQMFAVEQSKNPYADVEMWINDFVSTQINTVGETDFFNMYSQWHNQKRLWPKEDEYGRVLE